jgi:hypothetical protein
MAPFGALWVKLAPTCYTLKPMRKQSALLTAEPCFLLGTQSCHLKESQERLDGAGELI